MSSVPLVSIFMPVYNSRAYLAEAVESILTQDFGDLELVAVDDGSSDDSLHILEEYQKRDQRVRVHHQANQGRVAAANKALSLARGRYVARMDSDDVSLKTRIRRQVDFLEKNPQVGLCGTWQRCFGERRNLMRSPAEPEVVRCALLFECAVWSGTIMFRRELVADRGISYRNLNPQGMAEDYDLVARLSAQTKIANIPEVLVLYRTHPDQSVQLYRELKRDTARQIRLEQLRQMGLDPTDAEIAIHQSVSYFSVPAERESVLEAETWLKTLCQAAKACGLYEEQTFRRVVFHRWRMICMIASRLGMWTWNTYRQSRLTQGVSRSVSGDIRLGTKCALRWSRDWESGA